MKEKMDAHSIGRLKEANDAFNREDFRLALRLFRELLAENPLSPYLHIRVANLLLLQDENAPAEDDFDAVEAHYLAAYQIDPVDPSVLTNLAFFYDVMVCKEEPAQHYAQLLEKQVQRYGGYLKDLSPQQQD